MIRPSDRFWKAAATLQYTPKPGTSADGKTQAQQERSPFVYVWFGGAPEEDVQSFVYSVQRTALSQNRQTDDAWIVRYVETCLSGDALLWFSALEGETKRSWTRLSEAFLHNFAPPPQTKGRYENPSSPANPFEHLLLSPKPGKTGAVQVIDAADQGFLGYLCKNLTFAVDPHASDALLVECPASGPDFSLEEPTYLRIAVCYISVDVESPHLSHRRPLTDPRSPIGTSFPRSHGRRDRRRAKALVVDTMLLRYLTLVPQGSSVCFTLGHRYSLFSERIKRGADDVTPLEFNTRLENNERWRAESRLAER